MSCWPPALDCGMIGGLQNGVAGLFAPYVGNPAGLASSQAHTVLAAAAAAAAAAANSPVPMKDSRWLTLEVCRQYQRKMCSRNENECKFAHPPPHLDVQSGRVICCYDSIKGKCQRRDPPCKYFHPPQHLRELLLQNGRNNLILKNMHLQILQQQFAPGAMMPGLSPTIIPTTADAVPSTGAGVSLSSTVTGGAAQCPTPGSPINSMAAPLSSTGKVIYPPAHGLPTSYSLLLSQPTQQQPPPPQSTVFGTSSNHVLTPKPAGIDFIYANLYATDDLTQQVTRKRPATCINESAYSTLYPPLIVGYSPQLDPQYLAVTAGAQLGVGLSPYLTPSQLNTMAAAAVALKAIPPTVSLTNGGSTCSPPGVGMPTPQLVALTATAVNPLIPTGTPAKRPALTDTKSGLPMFECRQGLYALQTHLQSAKLPPGVLSSVSSAASLLDGICSPENGGGHTGVGEAHVGQFYPETYIEIPQYGYQ